MGIYQRIREVWKKPKKNLGPLWKERLIQWRKDNSVTKIIKPTRIDRARELGYKAKKGFVVARSRIKRGGRKGKRINKGRRSRRATQHKVLKQNFQWIAEQRANKKFPNLEVLNSYYVAEDGNHYWYEVILIDPERPEIKKDKKINWICNERGRVYRGLTSAGKKSRGLRRKGMGAEKIRPSIRSHNRKGK